MIHHTDLYRSIKVNDSLYYYVWEGRGNNCNTCLFPGILRGKRPHVIVDPGNIVNEAGETCFEDLAQTMGRDGFQVQDTGLVITTHYHTDHCASTETLVQKAGALATVSREDYEMMQATSERMYASFGATRPAFIPFFYLKEGRLDLGVKERISLQVIPSPGHSPGSMCLYWSEQKVLITGDVVFAGSMGRTDFPGGSLAAIRKSIERLAALDVEYLLPGHGTQRGSMISGKAAVTSNFGMVRMLLS